MSSARIAVVCLTCLEPTPYAEVEQGRCVPCHRDTVNAAARSRYAVKGRRGRDEVHDSYAWRRTSKRARQLQRFCSDCGTTEDLSADHTPAAHHALQRGKPVTLNMVEVVCRSCNAKRGPAGPGSDRWNTWIKEQQG